MKTIFISMALVLCTPVLGWGQGSLSSGVGSGVWYATLEGQHTGPSPRVAWGGSVWGEWMNERRWLGVQMELAYMPRGGEVVDASELKGEFVTLALVPRLHLAELLGGAEVVFGGGVFTNLFAVNAPEGAGSGDVGAVVQLGAG